MVGKGLNELESDGFAFQVHQCCRSQSPQCSFGENALFTLPPSSVLSSSGSLVWNVSEIFTFRLQYYFSLLPSHIYVSLLSNGINFCSII